MTPTGPTLAPTPTREAPTWFALFLSPRAWPARSQTVRADRQSDDGATLTLWDADRPVHRVPLALVEAAHPHPTHKAAEDDVRRQRERRVGGATVHVAEAGTSVRPTSLDPAIGAARRGATRGGSAVPAEGISVRIDER